MTKVQFVSRADDLGSSLSANKAIAAVTRAGFIKNVSVMAPGPFVPEAAELLKNRKDLCFGLHTTLNSEWSGIKWGPILPSEQLPGLVDANGAFLSDPKMFKATKPAVETVMREVAAQLEYVHRLGFDIRYIDSHMFPELFIPGLDEAMADFARKKGLLDHMYFYALPPGFMQIMQQPKKLPRYLMTIPKGQYFFVTHPSLNTEEMRRHSGEDIAKARAKETALFSKKATSAALKLFGCGGIRYDAATPHKRTTVEDVKALFL